jgi:endogenous inhibitor of DNA gyrase (YacG/DUF329 family)
MSTPVTWSYNTRRPVSRTEHVTVRAQGRSCAHDGCDTLLSIYNPTKYCSAHASEARSRRGGGLQAERTVTCGNCGEKFETRNVHRQYCSSRCRMAAFARRKRQAERALRRLQEQQAELAGPRAKQRVKDAA